VGDFPPEQELESEPLISVVITAYNRREYLERAVESALNQTLPRDKYEVIVTKNFDCEHDEEWKRRGVKLIRFDEPSLGKRVAQALPHCRGEVIAFLDDDDWWAPNKLERVAQIWGENPSTVYYHDNTLFFCSNSESLQPYKYWRRLDPWHNSSSVCIDKEVLIQNIRYLERCMSVVDLLYFYAAKVSGGRIVFDNVSLTHYRVPTSPRVERRDARRRGALVVREMVAESGNLKVLKEFDLLNTYDGCYWLNVERVMGGGRGSLENLFWFAYRCVRVFPPFWERRLFLGALDVFLPGFTRRLRLASG